MWRCGRKPELLSPKDQSRLGPLYASPSLRCGPRCVRRRSETQLRTGLATVLRPSFQLGYSGTQIGSDARFSSSVALAKVQGVMPFACALTSQTTLRYDGLLYDHL